MLACAAPFTIAIGGVDGLDEDLPQGHSTSLRFVERGSSGRVLGKLGLQHSATVQSDGGDVHCFTVEACSNYCLPRVRLWARYLHWAWLRRRQPPDIRMTALDVHAMPVAFICPRPVVLVSVAHGGTGNIFPMNLMGSLGAGLFGFALNSTRQAAQLVRRAGRVALSSVPLEQAEVVRQMGGNHKRESIDWREVSFRLTASAELGLPVPRFSLRVRELEVLSVRDMGSHTFFLARTLQDERRADGLQFFMVHGFYQAWRQKALDAAF
jgi:flavin reductase (DIM6/NTAB) family NADH-FMN oxidoreductase RutF